MVRVRLVMVFIECTSVDEGESSLSPLTGRAMVTRSGEIEVVLRYLGANGRSISRQQVQLIWQ